MMMMMVMVILCCIREYLLSSIERALVCPLLLVKAEWRQVLPEATHRLVGLMDSKGILESMTPFVPCQ